MVSFLSINKHCNNSQVWYSEVSGVEHTTESEMTNTNGYKSTLNQLEMNVDYWNSVVETYSTPTNHKSYSDAVRALVAFKDGKVEIAYWMFQFIRQDEH